MFNPENSVFIRSLFRKPVERTPIWLMRQAGRYLPEYRKTRELAGDFLNLCKNPDLACEVTLQPIRRFNFDASILFSDILTIPEAMNLGLYFKEGEGPKFTSPINDPLQIGNFPANDLIIENLSYVMQTTSLIRKNLPIHLPLIGFSGSPWTLASYMIEGESSREFKKILKFLYLHPESLHILLDKLADIISIYLEQQILNGANALMIFDTWGGILTTNNYQVFSLHYMDKIINKLKSKYREIPVIIFTKGSGQWLSLIASTNCDAVSLDWTCDLKNARSSIGSQKALQGNLDPVVLLTTPPIIRREVQKILEQYGYGSGFIFNLGHGVTPDVPPENVEALVQAVHEFSPSYHERRMS